MGHLVCSPCRDKLPDSKCQVCSGVVLQSSCYGMERVVESILVPCPYAEHGCTESIIYYLKEEHKKACPHAPCFCPNPGCGFAGPTVALLDHFTAEHKWPTTAFKYNYTFCLVAKPGVHVLRGQDGNIFLLNVALPMSPLHAVSLVCIQPNSSSELSSFRCYVDFSCWKEHHQHSSLEAIRNSSLSDGLPTDCFCFVPMASVKLSITINNELMHTDEDGDEEDEDEEECIMF